MSSSGTRPLAEKTSMNATSCSSITLSDPIKPPPPPPAAVISDHRPFSFDDDVLSLSVLGPTARDTPDMILFLLLFVYFGVIMILTDKYLTVITQKLQDHDL